MATGPRPEDTGAPLPFVGPPRGARPPQQKKKSGWMDEGVLGAIRGLGRAFFPSTGERVGREPVVLPLISTPGSQVRPGTTNLFDLIGTLVKDFTLDFAITKEIAAATGTDAGQLASKVMETLGTRGLSFGERQKLAGLGAFDNIRTPEMIAQIEKAWSEASKEGDIFDNIAGFSERMLEFREERDPYFYMEKLISEMADPLILGGWQGKAVRWIPGLGKPLAGADLIFTNAMAGMIDVPVKWVRAGVAASSEFLAEGSVRTVRFGSKLWEKLPIVTRKQALERQAKMRYEDFRVVMGGDFALDTAGSVNRRIPELIVGAQTGMALGKAGARTAELLARIEAGMEGKQWTNWLMRLLEASPQAAARLIRGAAMRTYTKAIAERVAETQSLRSAIGEVLNAPGRLASLADVRMWQPAEAMLLRPWASLYLRTPQYPWANFGEDILRSFLGHVTPAFADRMTYLAIRSGHPGMVIGLAPEGRGLTLAGEFIDDAFRPPDEGFIGPFTNSWAWYKDWTIGLSRRLTIPIQRNYDAQRLILHIKELWHQLGIDDTLEGRTLKSIINMQYLPGEVEHPQAIKDLLLAAFTSGDPIAVDAVIESMTGARVSERLANNVMKGVPIPKHVMDPLRQWVRDGGRMAELANTMEVVRQRMLDEVKAQPKILGSYLKDSLDTVSRDLSTFQTVEQATTFINNTNMMLQNLRHVPGDINKATAHVVSHPKYSSTTRERLWRESDQAVADARIILNDITDKANTLIDQLAVKFPGAPGLDALNAHRRYLQDSFAVLDRAGAEAESGFIMKEVALELGSPRRTNLFWEKFYAAKAAIYERAQREIREMARKLADDLGIVGDLDQLANKATNSDVWAEFNANIGRVQAGLIKSKMHPAVSGATTAKIRAQGESLKEIMRNLPKHSPLDVEMALRARTTGTLEQKLEVLREGGDVIINGKRKHFTGAGQQAADDTKNTFVNYDDGPAFDALMGHLYPFWKYASRSNLWLTRQALMRPKMFELFWPGEGSFWENTENGYIPTVLPHLGVQFGIIKTIMLGRMNNLASRPLYEPRHRGMAGYLDRAFDISAKLGFFPHSLLASIPDLASRLTGGQFALPGEALPPAMSGAVDAMTLLSPGVLGELFRTIFPGDFHDRNIAMAMFEAGIVPDYNTVTGQFENPESELSPALQRAAMWRLLIDQVGMFRARPEAYRQVLVAIHAAYVEALVADGIPQEEAEAIVDDVSSVKFPFERAKRISDTHPISQLTYEKLRALDGYEAAIRVNAPLTKDELADVRNSQREFFAQLDELMKVDNNLQLREDARSGLSAREGNFMSPGDWLANLKERQTKRANYVNGLTGPTGQFRFTYLDGKVKGVPFSEEEQIGFRLLTGLPSPLIHEDDQIIRGYYAIDPENFRDKYNPDLIDWGAVYLARGIYWELIPEAKRKPIQDHVRRNDTPKVRRFTEANQGFMQVYWDADRQGPKFYRDVVAIKGTPEERARALQVADSWERLIKEVERERVLLDVAHKENDLRAVERIEGSRSRRMLTKLRSDYKDVVSMPRRHVPGSDTWHLARGIQDFLQEFMPNRAN